MQTLELQPPLIGLEPVDATIQSARMLLFDSNGNVLTVMRPSDANAHQKFLELPGGKRDYLTAIGRWESPAETAIRETFEETGYLTQSDETFLTIERMIPDGKYAGKQSVTTVLAGQIIGGKLGAGSEQLPVIALPPEQLVAMRRITPATREVARMLCRKLATL